MGGCSERKPGQCNTLPACQLGLVLRQSSSLRFFKATVEGRKPFPLCLWIFEDVSLAAACHVEKVAVQKEAEADGWS